MVVNMSTKMSADSLAGILAECHPTVGRYLGNISADSANWYSTEGCTNYTRSLKLMAYMLFLFFTLLSCALGKIEGSPVLWTCEMIFMKKLKFSTHPRVIGVKGHQVLLEHILTLYIVLVIYSQQTQMSKSLNSSTKHGGANPPPRWCMSALQSILGKIQDSRAVNKKIQDGRQCRIY